MERVASGRVRSALCKSLVPRVSGDHAYGLVAVVPVSPVSYGSEVTPVLVIELSYLVLRVARVGRQLPRGGHEVLCTRDAHARAKSDTRLAVSGRSCPFLHTLPYGVCFSGHAEADSGGHASVCAHGTPARVQSRTQDWPYRAVLVRFCTLSSAPCAQADTTTGEEFGRPGVREWSTADEPAWQAETIPSS